MSDAQHAGEFAAGMHPTAPPPGSPELEAFGAALPGYAVTINGRRCC